MFSHTTIYFNDQLWNQLSSAKTIPPKLFSPTMTSSQITKYLVRYQSPERVNYKQTLSLLELFMNIGIDCQLKRMRPAAAGPTKNIR